MIYILFQKFSLSSRQAPLPACQRIPSWQWPSPLVNMWPDHRKGTLFGSHIGLHTKEKLYHLQFTKCYIVYKPQIKQPEHATIMC